MTKIHVCVLDRHCWKMWWQLAMPMRVHVGRRQWDIPVLTAIANWRTPRIWDLENPVRRQRPSFRECQGCGTVWHDDDPENGEHHYPWCPIDGH